MSSSNNLTTSAPTKATAHVSHRAEIHDQAKAAADDLWQGPFHVPGIASPNGTAAVSEYQPPDSTAPRELWAIWSIPYPGPNQAETTVLVANVGRIAEDGSLGWQPATAVLLDTQDNHIQSAFTPSLTVFKGQLHLIVVKPDGRGTLAHYVYIDDAHAWEYNSGWSAQPQTAAGPSVAAFSKSGQDLLYLAFAIDIRVHVCTYTPSTTDGVKYGTWSAPALTRLLSNDYPALFTSPRRTGPELHMAVVSPEKRVSEQVMGNSPGEWLRASPQPGGMTKGGVGACNTDSEAILAAPTSDAENPTLQYTLWTEDGNTWPASWTDAPTLSVRYGDVAPIVFGHLLCCFYVVSVESGYRLAYVTQQLHGTDAVL